MAKERDDDISIWNSKLSELEKLVVAGQHDQCQQMLDSIAPHKVPRQFAPQVAQIASRIHHSIYALKVLFRFVYPENSFAEPARDSEKMIYAYALSNLGAEEEALLLLESVSAEKEPEVLFQRAMAYVKQWNYAKTIPVLKEFIDNPSIAPYRRLVAQVNLAAALICQSKWSEVDELLLKIQAVCLENNYNLLLGNSHELQAQSYFFQGRYKEALRSLERSAEYLKEQKGIYFFFVEKWTVLCRCFQNPSAEHMAQLESLRQQSVEKMYWDTTRELDFFRGLLESSEEAFRKVMMGTPSEAYRQRARQMWGKSMRSVGSYRLHLGGAISGSTARTFDPHAVSKDGSSLSEKPHLLALFEALTLDFYRPIYLGAIFKHVYPEEHFNPTTSPPRVMRLLVRLDKWFEAQKLPLRVYFKKSEFALHSLEPMTVMIQRGPRLSVADLKWKTLREHFDGKPISASKISEALGISKRTSLRLISQALTDGEIEKVGQSRGTEYRFKARKKRDPAAS